MGKLIFTFVSAALAKLPVPFVDETSNAAYRKSCGTVVITSFTN